MFAGITKIASHLYNWYKNNKPTTSNITPIVQIDIHYEKISKIQLISLPIDKEYSTEEIKEMVGKAELDDIVDGLFDYENEQPPQQ